MADKQFRLRILTPERVFYEGMADMVIFQGVEGELGVLPGHIPLDDADLLIVVSYPDRG